MAPHCPENFRLIHQSGATKRIMLEHTLPSASGSNCSHFTIDALYGPALSREFSSYSPNWGCNACNFTPYPSMCVRVELFPFYHRRITMPRIVPRIVVLFIKPGLQSVWYYNIPFHLRWGLTAGLLRLYFLFEACVYILRLVNTVLSLWVSWRADIFLLSERMGF
jgi:hypothetical protein